VNPSHTAKTVITGILLLLVFIVGWIVFDRHSRNDETQLYNEMLAAAARTDATEVSVDARKLDILLNASATTGENDQRNVIYQALILAKATDNTDVDSRIAHFATRPEMLSEVREVLIRDVLRKRKNPAVVPILMAFARSTDESRAAVAALQSVRFMAGDDQFGAFLSVITGTAKEEVRLAAEESLGEIIRKSANRSGFSTPLAKEYQNSLDPNIRHSLLRLLGRCGGTKALELVKEQLGGPDARDKVAAISSLGTWSDDAAFPLLLEFLTGCDDPALRTRTFDSAIRFLSDPTTPHPAPASEGLWNSLSSQAKSPAEQEMMIRALVNYTDEWALNLVESFSKSNDTKIADLSNKALARMRGKKSSKPNQK
jgi:HEAT repeat protein